MDAVAVSDLTDGRHWKATASCRQIFVFEFPHRSAASRFMTIETDTLWNSITMTNRPNSRKRARVPWVLFGALCGIVIGCGWPRVYPAGTPRAFHYELVRLQDLASSIFYGGLAGGFTALFLSIVSGFLKRELHWQFGIRDLLLVVLVVALFCSVCLIYSHTMHVSP